MNIRNYVFIPADAKATLRNATRIALAGGVLAVAANPAWAQFGDKTTFDFETPPTPAKPAPRFVEEKDTTDFVSDRVREEATNFLNQENLKLTADIELDFDAIKPDDDDPSFDDDATYDSNGRVRLTIEGNHTAGDRYFSGRAEALFTEDGEGNVDDWFAFGDATWDLQLGRFEAINLFPLGLDTVIVNAGGGSVRDYQLNLARGRVGDGGGQIAGRYRFTENLRTEVDLIWGDPYTSGDNTDTIAGVRPSVTFANDPFTVSVGGEWVQFDLDNNPDGSKPDPDEVDRMGYGATFRYDAAPVLAHFNVAHLEDDELDSDVTSFGANLIYDGRIGIGVIHSINDFDDNNIDDADLTTFYGAYVIPIFGFDRARVTFGASYSMADNDAGPPEDLFAGRVRFNYAF